MNVPAIPRSSRLYGLDPSLIPRVIATAEALEAGRVDDAERALAPALAAAPDHAELLRLRAGILAQRGDLDGATRAIGRAVEQRPDDPIYLNTLGTVLSATGDYDAAIDALRRAAERQPGLAAAWYNLGVLLTRSVRHEEAADALARAVAIAPDHMLARALLADMLRVNGRHAEAAAEYRTVLAERPTSGMAWWGLADLKTMRFADDDVARMRAALADRSASDDDRIATGFALARALDDEGHHAESLAALAEANTIARRRRAWNAPAFSAGIDATLAAFDPPPRGAAAPIGGEVVFVASPPRSGSTLIEQILASHSKVEGAGELADLPHVIGEESRRRGERFPFWTGAMRPEDWERLGRRYLERTAHWRRTRPMFVDKLPGNWMYVGAIAAMLPEARIVLARRDPLETCLSCYRQHLDNNEYTRTFADLAAFWLDFDRSARIWADRHPDRVRIVDYEKLIADPETEIRALLAFCGLDFEAACLDFHANPRAVRSPSATQVREPIRRDTARADRYGALLDPLRAALGLPPFADRDRA